MEESEAVAGIPRPRASTWRTAASLTDIAAEQFDLLAEHVSDGFCVSGCEQCRLLVEVRTLLLAKFRVTDSART